MAIDVVIPFHNQPELLFACLSSLASSAGHETRLVLVDDASDDAAFSRIEHRCHALPIPFEYRRHDKNRGFIGSIHTGMEVATAPVVILLNSDTVVTPRFDVRLAEVLERHDSVKAVAPVTNAPTDLYQYRPEYKLDGQTGTGLYSAIARHAAQAATKRFGEITTPHFLTGCCLALDRAAYAEVGGFSSDYSHGYFEDLDLCCRLREKGYGLAVREDCFIYHRGQGSYRHTDRSAHARRMEHNFSLFQQRWGHVPGHGELLRLLESLSVQP